jgi:hypothetical protein
MPKVVIYCLAEDWDGIYVDGLLHSGTDGLTACDLVRILVEEGLLKEGDVTFKDKEKDVGALDDIVCTTGEFPETWPPT